MTILILHGIDGYAGIHWQQWLHDSLEKMGNSVIMPTLPQADHPSRQVWLTTIEHVVNHIPTNELIIIAHSLGVASALDFIEISKTKVKALISVSGFAEDYGSPLNNYFMKGKKINFNKIKHNAEYFSVIYGDNDPFVPQQTLQKLSQQLQITPYIIHQGGHLNTDSGYSQFPLLLEIVKKLS